MNTQNFKNFKTNKSFITETKAGYILKDIGVGEGSFLCTKDDLINLKRDIEAILTQEMNETDFLTNIAKKHLGIQ